jgi:DNA polymerase-3 subunit epsilon
LIAALKESEEIKINKPICNRVQRKNSFPIALYADADEKGYLNLKLQKADGRKKEITSYATLQEGKNALFRISAEYKLCQKLTGLYIAKAECFQHKINECDGACVQKVTFEEYNLRVQEFILKNSFENQNLIIREKGRTINERSAVLIENGIYKGYAFFDLNYQINTVEILKNILVSMQNNRDARNIIQSHLRKNKNIKITHF